MHQTSDTFGKDAVVPYGIGLAHGVEANGWQSGQSDSIAGDNGRSAASCCFGIASTQYHQQQQQRAERQRHP